MVDRRFPVAVVVYRTCPVPTADRSSIYLSPEVIRRGRLPNNVHYKPRSFSALKILGLTSNCSPRYLLTPDFPVRVFNAEFPNATITRGRTAPISSIKYLRHASNSLAAGSRFSGGRQRTLFVTNTSSRRNPACSNISLSTCPARPTNGTPWRSSVKPGASPTIIICASLGPLPSIQIVVAFAESGQRSQ